MLFVVLGIIGNFIGVRIGEKHSDVGIMYCAETNCRCLGTILNMSQATARYTSLYSVCTPICSALLGATKQRMVPSPKRQETSNPDR